MMCLYENAGRYTECFVFEKERKEGGREGGRETGRQGRRKEGEDRAGKGRDYSDL